MPFSAMGSEGKTEQTGEATEKAPWVDIKKAPGPQFEPIPEKYSDLVQTFSEYWKARKELDYKRSYELESNEYRKMTSFDLYNEKLKKSAIIEAVRPLEVKPISEKEVMVRASVGYKAGIIDTVRFFQDQWLKEDGGWKHLPEKEKEEKKEEKK